MGDAHHLLHSSSSSMYSQYLGSGWDLEILNTRVTAESSSRLDGVVSTGYLEDALLLHRHYTPSPKRRKRRRVDDNNNTSASDEVGTVKSRSSSNIDEEAVTLLQERGKVIKGLVYPFQVVKPLGELRLKDINQRMLMPPTRPVPHPVGTSSPPPYYYYAPGLSGNPVVALTTIHTQPTRGTITIITTTP